MLFMMSTVANGSSHQSSSSKDVNSSASLAARLGLGQEVRELKLGKSFSSFSSKSSASFNSSSMRPLGSKVNGRTSSFVKKTNHEASSSNEFNPTTDAFHTLKCKYFPSKDKDKRTFVFNLVVHDTLVLISLSVNHGCVMTRVSFLTLFILITKGHEELMCELETSLSRQMLYV